MQWHDFVFSDQQRYKNRRHQAFWLLWWMYIVFTIFFTRPLPLEPNSKNQLFFHHQPGLNELGFLLYSLLVLIKSLLLLLTHLLYCYIVVYFLIPRFLLRRKYIPMLAGLLAASVLIVSIGYFLYNFLYPLIDHLFRLNEPLKNIIWKSVDAGLINAIKVTLAASAIILLKRWWLKQKEKEKLEKEKINAELQLLKAQIHPAFLFSTLDNIISEAQVASSKAPEMLIKLSDLLSYMLYECDVPKVKLEKEIAMIREYMALEKIRQGRRLEMTVQINGNLNGQLISPLLLLPFVDKSISYSQNSSVGQAWINLDITIENNHLSLKLINGISADLTVDTAIDDESFLNVKKRLQLLYPGRYDLKVTADQELFMIHLNLKLEDATYEDQMTSNATNPVLSHA